MPDRSDPEVSARALAFALEKYPEQVGILPVASLVMDMARQNSKRPAYLKIAVPDEVVQDLRGSRESDMLLLVTVPRETADRAESPIVLPEEVR